MDCQDFESSIFELVQNNEDDIIGAPLEHVQSCISCRKLYESVSESLKIIEYEKSLKPNPFLTTRVMNELQTSEVKSFKLIHRMAFVVAMLAGLYIGFNIGNLHQTNETLASNELSEEFEYFDDFQQEGIEYNLITEEEW